MAHLPPRRMPAHSRTRLPPPRVDWNARDAQLAREVGPAAQRLRSKPGRPMQITIGSIGREIEKLSSLRSELDKLPLTAEALSKAVETREVLALRRISWAEELYRQEKVHPKMWRLMKRAGIKRKFATESPQVKEALEAALQALSQQGNAPSMAI